MGLILAHPEVAYRSCQDCKAWIFDHKTGKKEMRNGQPIPRLPGVKLPCEISAGLPEDVRERACAKICPTAGVELSEKNWQAYMHYLGCKATSLFPDDPIVRRNAAIISQQEETHKEIRLYKAIAAMRGA